MAWPYDEYKTSTGELCGVGWAYTNPKESVFCQDVSALGRSFGRECWPGVLAGSVGWER